MEDLVCTFGMAVTASLVGVQLCPHSAWQLYHTPAHGRSILYRKRLEQNVHALS